MADIQKKNTGTTPKVPATSGKGVALTARQALQAADMATAMPAAKRAAAAKPKAAASKVKAAPTAKAPAAKPAAKPVVAKVAAAVTQAPIAAKKAADVITPSIETPPQMEKAVHTAIAEGNTTMNDVIENTKKYTEEAKTRFQSAFAEMNEKAKTSVEKSTKTMEEMTDLAKGNVEAMVESGKIAAKGMEAMSQEAAEYSRMTFEKASAMMKSMAAVKSPAEFFQLQSEMLSSAFDAFAKESAKTSEAMIKLAGEVAQPLSSRMSVMTDKVKSLAA